MNINENNRLQGRVLEINEGDASAGIIIDIGEGRQIASIMPIDSFKKLNIRKGNVVSAIFNAASVTIDMDGDNYNDCSLGCDA